MVLIQDLGQYTFPALFNNSITKFSECNALSFVNTKPITYSQVKERTEQVASLLQHLGIKKGDKVAIWSGSDPNWCVSYFAIVNYGAIAVPILPDFSIKEVETILTHAGVSGIIISEKMETQTLTLKPKIVPFVIRLEDFNVVREKGKNLKNPIYYIDTIDTVLPHVLINEEDTASIIYTSGTTGRSKGVELTHKNLIFMAIQVQSIQMINKRDRCLSFLPLSHVYEFSLGFILQFMNGSCVYYLGKAPTVSSLLPAFKIVRPTIVLSVPIIMEKIYKNKIVPTFTKKPLIKKLYSMRFFQIIFHRLAGKSLKKTFGGRLRFFGIGGAKVDPVVEQFMKDAKFPYAIGYGLTETSPLLAGSNPKNTKPGTIGPAMEGVELKILDPDPETGIGEVVAKGENIMKGYYKEKELTDEVFTTVNDSVGPGWFKTGDLGEISRGRLSLKGRLKNMILGSGGENVYPEDIEFVLNQHPEVLESLVVEDDTGLVALVQLDEEKITQRIATTVGDIKESLLIMQDEILSEIKYYTNSQVNKVSKISVVRKVAEFEKTASSKIKRYLYNLTTGDKDKK